MNAVINLLTNHASCREFDPTYVIEPNTIQQLLQAAKQAATWMNGQAYSIIIIDQQHNKPAVTEILQRAGNVNNAAVMQQASVFILFCADLYKFTHLDNVDFDAINTPELTLISVVDASLAMQNMIVAAESLDLGTVVIGSIRRQGLELTKLLKLPEYVFPVAGVAIGKPLHTNAVKPRITDDINVFYAEYNTDIVNLSVLQNYAQQLKEWGQRVGYNRDGDWVTRFSGFFRQLGDNKVTEQLLRQQKFLK